METNNTFINIIWDVITVINKTAVFYHNLNRPAQTTVRSKRKHFSWLGFYSEVSSLCLVREISHSFVFVKEVVK